MKRSGQNKATALVSVLQFRPCLAKTIPIIAKRNH